MKHIVARIALGLLVSIIALTFLSACMLDREAADEAIRRIRYIQDSRTGVCFAYAWIGGIYGGPALATVPCEQVPLSLLVVVETK